MLGETRGLSLLAHTVGRAQYIAQDGTLYISRGYKVYRSKDAGTTWGLDAAIPADFTKRFLARFRYSSRLLRYYIAGLGILSDGTRLVIARDGIYRAPYGSSKMDRVFRIVRGSRPLNLGVGRENRVVFGEYGWNRERSEIFIYVSDDEGRSFQVGYVFKPGEIRHVHNVVYDPFLDRYWVLAGDFGKEPGIGLLERDFTRLEWLARGDQMARAVGVIVEPDYLLFGTDSELQQNYIIRMDKASGTLHKLRPVEGTSLFAARFGPARAISICVEPSRVNRERNSKLYASRDGEAWAPLCGYPKDFLPFLFFQYGTLVLPQSVCARPIGMYSGQAVSGLDNRACVVSFDDPKASPDPLRAC